MTPELRVLCIMAAADMLRESLRANGNRYEGTLVPNIQTITDLCVLSDEMLEAHLSDFPNKIRERLTPEAAAEIKQAWVGQ